ncbi:hydroxyethylthiazole kinase [Alicyclobacillaceae bacterium I2511]|nr:hydroxyethylthiazole kinase [Alicyclobacillaceae bacterium I2511]
MEPSRWLEQVRAQHPLVHNITNLVVTHIAANALISIGASPVMAYAREEVADMARIAGSLALNMGTLDDRVVEAMEIAGKSANLVGVPVIFDPVGVGATPYRNQVAAQLTDSLQLALLKGNGGEMSFLLGAGGQVKGVDASVVSNDLPRALKEYAQTHQCAVMATGAVDYVSDGQRVWMLSNGHPLLAAITGSGCMATAVLGGFLAVAGKQQTPSVYAEAAIAGLTCYNVAAEIAAKKAAGPGTFQSCLFDALYYLDGRVVNEQAKVSEVSLS